MDLLLGQNMYSLGKEFVYICVAMCENLQFFAIFSETIGKMEVLGLSFAISTPLFYSYIIS